MKILSKIFDKISHFLFGGKSMGINGKNYGL